MKYKEFKPEWKPNIGGCDTFRARMKWGNPQYIQEPSEALYMLIKEKLNLSDADFVLHNELGDEVISHVRKAKIGKDTIAYFEGTLGKINVKKDEVSRVCNAYGKAVNDNLRLREKIIDNVPDLVLTPVNEEQISSIMNYCVRNKINVYMAGGKTNCNGTTECYNGGVCLDLKQNFNKITEFNATNQTITVMSGITGPQIEEFLNNITDYFPKLSYKYALGHIPNSFEFSTVGGWVNSRSVGNNATLIGGIDDLLISARYLTPKGIVDTKETRLSSLPNINEVFIGSNGQYGILLTATLKVRRHSPDDKYGFSRMFPSITSAIKFVKEIAQSENGLPSSLQLCDPDRTEMIMRLNPTSDNGVLIPFLRELSKSSTRCLVIGSVLGAKPYVNMMKRFIVRNSAAYGGRNATNFVTKNWESTQFDNAYIRDLFQDFNVIFDKFECVVSWSEIDKVFATVKNILLSRKDVFVMTGINHISAHTCTIQFEYVLKVDSKEDYIKYRDFVLESCEKIGILLTANYSFIDSIPDNFNKFMSPIQIGFYAALKKYFDPNNILTARPESIFNVANNGYADKNIKEEILNNELIDQNNKIVKSAVNSVKKVNRSNVKAKAEATLKKGAEKSDVLVGNTVKNNDLKQADIVLNTVKRKKKST